jgi:hypothetical protein
MMTLYIQHYFSLLYCTRDTYSGFVIPVIVGSQETAFSLSPYPSYNILFMNAIINIQTLEYASISYIFAHFLLFYMKSCYLLILLPVTLGDMLYICLTP